MLADQVTTLRSGLFSLATFIGTRLRHAPIAIGAIVGAAAFTPADAQGIVQRGYAVTTGFAGIVSYPAPDGAEPFDYVTINTEGYSARVVDLRALGPQGSLSAAPKPFSVTAAQVGQVFGATLDNAQQPNIYLGATSAYGLNIYVPDGSGQLQRVHKGTAGAQFVPGQFGPAELGGGPGSIWRVDGVNGAVSLLATIDGGSGSVAGIGSLAFDPNTQQIFASELGTGIVYRLGLDGTVRGTYDHGTEGRPAGGLGPLPMPGAVPVNVESPTFDTGNPKTWGFTPPARRVVALAVHNRRLYYSVSQGPQIWSAGIGASGSIPGNDARLEVEVPSLGDGVEITSITFDGQGRMYLAERGATNGDYFLYQLAADGQSRVLRYVAKQLSDANPGFWRLTPDQYAIGMSPIYDNADGGVALNYGYNSNGQINFNACGATVWSTGDRLLDPGDGTPPESYEHVEGLQGNSTSLVEPQNAPPTASWFVDYDDQSGDASLRGYNGAIATIPCAAPTPPPPPPPPLSCPPGTYFSNGQCLIVPICPPGTQYRNGQCIYPQCPPGFIENRLGICIPPPQACPRGYAYYQGECVPLGCPPGLERTPSGFCACPRGEVYVNGECLPPQRCLPPFVELPGGVCFCPLGLVGGDCRPPQHCADDEVLTVDGRCQPLYCPPGQIAHNHQCVPITCDNDQDLFNGVCVNSCPQGYIHVMPGGQCIPEANACPLGQDLYGGSCVNVCPLGQRHMPPDGHCEPKSSTGIKGGGILINPGVIQPAVCPPGQEMYNGNCVDKCAAGQVHTPPNGVCKKPAGGGISGGGILINPGIIQPLACPAGQEMYDGNCVAKCPAGQVHTPPNGVCKKPAVLNGGGVIQGAPKIIAPVGCPDGQEMYNGTCVAVCAAGQVHMPPNGVCKKPSVLNGGGVIQGAPKIIAPVGCPAGQEMYNGACVAKCAAGQVHTPPNGACKKPVVLDNGGAVGGAVTVVPKIIAPAGCSAGQDKYNGACVAKCAAGQVHTPPDGACKAPGGDKATGTGGATQDGGAQAACKANQDNYNGTCLPKCPAGKIHTPPNGACRAPAAAGADSSGG